MPHGIRRFYLKNRFTICMDGNFDIYSDIDSKIKHLKRVRTFFAGVAGVNLFIGVLNSYFGNMSAALGKMPFNTYVVLPRKPNLITYIR